MNSVLKTTQYVVKNSKHVTINNDKIGAFVEKFDHKHIKHWLNESPFDYSKLSDDEKLHFLLVFNSSSFCYWGDPKWTIKYKGEDLDGSWAMIACIGKAIERGIPILNAEYLANLTKEKLQEILNGNTEIPLFQERLNFFREVGNILAHKYGGEFRKTVELAKGDALELLKLIVENFPSFNDSSMYKGKKIFFYKRAQLLVADIYQTFEGKGIGNLRNVEALTACADYKLPMILRKWGILTYSLDLARKIDGREIIPKDSEEEIEIRANTVWATELIKDKLRSKIPHVDSTHVSDHLWFLGQNKSPDDKPYLLNLHNNLLL